MVSYPEKNKTNEGCDFPLINHGTASSFVLLRSEIQNLGHCEEMTPLCMRTASERGGGGWGPVRAVLIDDAASDYEHRISTLGLV